MASPIGLDVSKIPSDRLLNVIPFSLKSFKRIISSLVVLPRRSTLKAIKVSPGLICSRSFKNSGRFRDLPETFSWKIFSQPAFLSASVCKFRFCSLVETLAYPKIIIVLIYVQTKIKRTLIYEKRLIELYMFKNENSK